MNRLRSKIDLKAEHLGWLEDDLRGSLVRRTQDLDIFDCDECKRGEAGQ